jgi:hypothetical protein
MTDFFDAYMSNPHRTRYDEVAAEFGRRLIAVRDISINSISQLLSSDDTRRPIAAIRTDAIIRDLVLAAVPILVDEVLETLLCQVENRAIPWWIEAGEGSESLAEIGDRTLGGHIMSEYQPWVRHFSAHGFFPPDIDAEAMLEAAFAEEIDWNAED